METPQEQPDQSTQDEETGDMSADPAGETPTPATLPSDSEPESDAREGDDEHEGETDSDEQSEGS